MYEIMGGFDALIKAVTKNVEGIKIVD